MGKQFLRTGMRAGAALTCALATFTGATIVSATPASPIVVYGDSLAPGWADWSWSTQINWADTLSPHSGSDDIAFTFNNGWDGLSMHDDSNIDTTPYDILQFWVNGDAVGGQDLSVYVDYPGGGSSTPVDAGPYIAGGTVVAHTWKLVQIPLSVLGASATQIDRLDFFNNTGSAQPEMLLDDISIANDGKTPPPPATKAVNVSVDATAGVHAISPLIYGVAFGGSTYLNANNLTLDRWGGNAVTRYNWRLGNASNTASDWYFENTNNSNTCDTPGCAVDQFVQSDRSAKAASLITVPTIGWVAKNSDLNTCGFQVSKYGAQQQTDPYRPNCGNGLKPNGQPITGNNPKDTSVPSTPADIKAWIKHLVKKFGTASKGGVRFYAMDNEPELWNSTHRDVHPKPLTYAGLYSEFETYATAVKQADPSAMIDGPIPWGWSAYLDSSYDYANNTQSDRLAHGNLPIIPWFLKTVAAHDKKAGKRTLNVLDIHYYPQEHNVFSDASDPTTSALRLRATRSLWDPSYTDESWINDKVDLIPRMEGWIKQYYPGTKFGVSEWNFGGEDSMSGALAIANVLGIYGREGVYLASYWTHPNQSTPATRAFDMYRDYDGHDSTFGNESVQTSSGDTNSLMTFGAMRGKVLTLMLVNQLPTTNDSVTLTLNHFAPGAQAQAQAYELGPSASTIQHLPSIPASTSMKVTVPAYSIELLVMPRS